MRLVVATDVDSPLTGLFGATRTFGAQKGILEERMPLVDGLLEGFAAVVTDFKTSLWRRAREPRADSVSACSSSVPNGSRDRPDRAGRGAGRPRPTADVVITGEGAFDFSSRAGKVPAGVAAIAADALRPCVALAGQVLVGSREMRALGMDAAYSLVDLVGEEEAFADAGGSLALLAQRVARTWSGGGH